MDDAGGVRRYTEPVLRESQQVALARQVSAFAGVGVVAAVVHYGVLIGLVEGARLDPVPATLAGYIAGGVVSYVLNRRHTYASERPHAEATWRFALVAFVGFLLTGAFMHAFTRWLGAPYLPAQLVTTGIVLLWSFGANRVWTFPEARETHAVSWPGLSRRPRSGTLEAGAARARKAADERPRPTYRGDRDKPGHDTGEG